MHQKRTATVLLAGVLAVAGAAQAGSIWAKAHDQGKRPTLFTDDTAQNIGDLLTIVIAERSVVENGTSRGLAKSSSRSASVDTNIDLIRGIDTITGELFTLPEAKLDASANTNFNGAADYDSERTMFDQITVTVADVLPNGNLVVVGTRQRETAGELQIIQVSGVVRPADITFSNTVQSEQVAEFKIVMKHDGRENRFTKPGWFSRVLNITNPF